MELHSLPESRWLEWLGPRTAGMRQQPQPHPLTADELVFVLRRFKVYIRNIFAKGGRQTRGPSQKGWYRSDFETAWANYCTKPSPAPSSPPPPPPALPEPGQLKPESKSKPRNRRRPRRHNDAQQGNPFPKRLRRSRRDYKVTIAAIKAEQIRAPQAATGKTPAGEK